MYAVVALSYVISGQATSAVNYDMHATQNILWCMAAICGVEILML